MRFLVCLAFFLVSCTDSHKTDNYKFERTEESGVVFDLVFPKTFWEQILRDSPPTIKPETSVYELYEALPIDVKLIEEKEGILRGKNHLVTFTEFGGQIDYSQYLNPEVGGDFRVYFEPEEPSEEDPAEIRKVYFLSATPQIQLGEEVFGGGCNFLYDVTQFFNKKVFKEGLLLHTAQNRYFYLTAGRFYFFHYLKNKIRVAQITFDDQRLQDKICQNRI